MMDLEKKIQYQFKDKELLKQALTHKSVFRKDRQKKSKLKNKKGIFLEPVLEQHGLYNERLEFLGDSVLSLCVSEMLIKAFPELQEGDLSKIRAALVREKMLSEIALDLGLNRWMRLGKGEKRASLSQKPRLLASLLEALIGAYFLDSSYVKVRIFIKRLFKSFIRKTELKKYLSLDFKTHLQEQFQKIHRGIPSYSVIREEGPDHNRVFYVRVIFNQECWGEGKGLSKKEAEQEAAKQALKKFSVGVF